MIIGGGGSLTSAKALGEAGVRAVGIPATIDNDVPGTELAIGVDTAVDTAVGAIDQVRGTAISHNRAHIVEVMGRDSGYLALMSAIAGGARSPSSRSSRLNARTSCASSRRPTSGASPTS